MLIADLNIGVNVVGNDCLLLLYTHVQVLSTKKSEGKWSRMSRTVLIIGDDERDVHWWPIDAATSGVINIDKLKSTLESWFWNQSWYTWSTVTGDGKLLGSQMRGPSERYERGVSLRAQPSEGRGNVIDVNQLQEHFFLRRKPWAYDSTKRTKTVQQGWWIHTLPVWRHQTYYLG